MGKKEYLPKHAAEVTQPKAREVILDTALVIHPFIWAGFTGARLADGRYGFAAGFAVVTGATELMNRLYKREENPKR